MFREWLARVREVASGERAWGDVCEIAKHHRIQSSPGYDAAADWLEASLAGLGLEVGREMAPGDGRTRRFGQLLPEGWAVSHARAWLHSAAGRELLCDFDIEPLSLVQRSAPATGRFRLIAEPADTDATAPDLHGAVVLTQRPAHQALEHCVRDHGAAGLVCDFRRLVPPVRTATDDLDSLAYTSFWWAGDEPRAWGFVVTPRQGAALRRRLAAGERLELEVDLATRRFESSIPLVTAHLPGQSAQDVLVVAHLCHPKPGAHDNASGVAAALETARIVAALAPGATRPRRGIRFLWMPELTGTFAWLGADPARALGLTAALNLDMVGADQAQCGSTFLLEHPPCFAASFAEELLAAIRAEALDWITSYSGPGHFSLMRLAEVPYSGGSDHAVFVDPSIGVPCPMLIHWPDRFYHSSYDTPDRVDPRSLEVSARCAATYALFLAHAGDAEAEWLTALVARGARRRLLAAASAADARRALARERVRGDAALASLSRLGASAAQLEAQRAALTAFADREAGGLPAAGDPASGSRVPRRLKRGPLDFLDHQNPGWDLLVPAERERWSALGLRRPQPGLELAWFAADGHRSCAAIAALVGLETGECDAGDVEEFFELLARMNLSVWTTHGS